MHYRKWKKQPPLFTHRFIAWPDGTVSEEWTDRNFWARMEWGKYLKA